MTGSEPINTRQNDLVIEFHEDYTIPASIRNTSVAITTVLVRQDEGGTNEAEDDVEK